MGRVFAVRCDAMLTSAESELEIRVDGSRKVGNIRSTTRWDELQ